ncbi:hypothetical protein COB55_06065 [Candidatus Wolfebacteria bacterium]|nr:MAG: hypothetical protein COB55_06065 [Candidatus Wolfebacteria bacterium]
MTTTKIQFVTRYLLNIRHLGLSVIPIFLITKNNQGYLICMFGNEKIDLCPCCVNSSQLVQVIQDAVTCAIESGQVKGKVIWLMKWPVPIHNTGHGPQLNKSLFVITSFDDLPPEILKAASKESKKFADYLENCSRSYTVE